MNFISHINPYNKIIRIIHSLSEIMDTSDSTRVNWRTNTDPMHKHYIINNIIEFHPATSTLSDLNNPERVVVLNSPAGRCLLLLIERVGSIVTMQEFLDTVWQRRGMMVSPNTYYQNISILRKGLKKIGFEIDPIVTIPRIGLTLASDTQIIIKEPPQSSETIDKQHIVVEALSNSLPKPELAPATLSLANPRWLIGMLAILFILAGVRIIDHTNIRDNHFIDDYRFTGMLGTCRIYLANDIQTSNERAKAMAYVNQFFADCGSYPWVYISWYATLPRTSVIRCDKPMEEPNRCISDYFIEER